MNVLDCTVRVCVIIFIFSVFLCLNVYDVVVWVILSLEMSICFCFRV